MVVSAAAGGLVHVAGAGARQAAAPGDGRYPVAALCRVEHGSPGLLWAGVDNNVIRLRRDGAAVAAAWLTSEAVRCLAWARDRPLLAVGLADGSVLLLELLNG